MALPRVRAAALLLLSLYGNFPFAASLQSKVSSLSNTSSSDAVSLSILSDSSNNNEYDDCFNPPTPRRGLYPAREQDCLDAAKEIFNLRDPFKPTTFARKYNVGFKLPKVFRNGTCIISIDLVNENDRDHFKPWLVYTTAMDIAHRCTQGAFRLGGRTTTGPKKVVDVLVFGRVWPPENGALGPVGSEEDFVAVEGEIASNVTGVANEDSLNLTGPALTDTTSPGERLGWNASEVGGTLECYDPPLPRERAWPVNFKDCEMATDGIFKDRERDQKYTFSRGTVATKFNFSLPATFRFKSCVVLLDMDNNSDQDTVRLSIVEATAWVLAHKCSGQERSVDVYGGRTTVGVGSKDLINVWVYGRLWPPPVGATNVTNLVLAQPPPLIDSE